VNKHQYGEKLASDRKSDTVGREVVASRRSTEALYCMKDHAHSMSTERVTTRKARCNTTKHRACRKQDPVRRHSALMAMFMVIGRNFNDGLGLSQSFDDLIRPNAASLATWMYYDAIYSTIFVYFGLTECKPYNNYIIL